MQRFPSIAIYKIAGHGTNPWCIHDGIYTNRGGIATLIWSSHTCKELQKKFESALVTLKALASAVEKTQGTNTCSLEFRNVTS
jgi:hypothetical protein